jgi:hypothetical protein
MYIPRRSPHRLLTALYSALTSSRGARGVSFMHLDLRLSDIGINLANNLDRVGAGCVRHGGAGRKVEFRDRCDARVYTGSSSAVTLTLSMKHAVR